MPPPPRVPSDAGQVPLPEVPTKVEVVRTPFATPERNLADVVPMFTGYFPVRKKDGWYMTTVSLPEHVLRNYTLSSTGSHDISMLSALISSAIERRGYNDGK